MKESLPGSPTSAEAITGSVTVAAKPKRVVLSISAVFISGGLFVVSYFTMGRKVVIGDRFGATFFAFGTTVCFVSLWIAIRSEIRALIATLTILGVILGTIVLLISFFNTSYWKWLPAFVVLVMVVNGAFFYRGLKSRKPSDTR
jgi:hypothetical protein